MGPFPRLSATFLLLVSVGAAACGAPHIRDAQDTFNRAATEENRLYAAGLSTDAGLLSQASAATDYRIALALLEEALSRDEAGLRADRLYGTALMLKALCLWRLADLAEFGEGELGTLPSAMERAAASAGPEAAGDGMQPQADDMLGATLRQLSAEDANQGIVLGARDRALLRALPGLRDHDRGLRAEDYDTAKRFFGSATEVVGSAADAAPRQHPVRTYLLLAQLSTCRAWQSAAYGFLETGRADEEADVPLDKAQTIFAELEKSAEKDAALRRQLDTMKGRLGL